MAEQLLDWGQAHAELLSAVALGSLLMLVATPLLVPLWIASLPADYFVRPTGVPQPRTRRLRILLSNVLGGLLLVAGILMLVLPGQGLLTIFVGLSLMRFPGKRSLQRRLLGRPPVARAIQWMRRRAHKAPMELPAPHA